MELDGYPYLIDFVPGGVVWQQTKWIESLTKVHKSLG